MRGNDTILCQHNGSWTKSPQCLKRCAVPDIDHSNVTSIETSSFIDNSTLKVMCNDNAKLVGSSTIRCSNGTWPSTPLCQIFKCDVPSLKPHVIIETATIFHVNKTYKLNCEKGYHANSSLSAHCDKDGHWKMEGTCDIDTCGFAPDVPFSSHTGSSNPNHTYQYNDTLFYK